MVNGRTSAWQARAHDGEPSASLRTGCVWSQPPGTSSVGLSPCRLTGSSSGNQKQDQEGSKLQPDAIQSNPLRPAQGAWAKPIKPHGLTGQHAPPGNVQTRPGRQGGCGHVVRATQQAQQLHRSKETPAGCNLVGYPEIKQQLAVPRGRGRGSSSPGRSAASSPDPSPGCRSSKVNGVTCSSESAGRHSNSTENLAQQMQTTYIAHDPQRRDAASQQAHYTQEPQHAASLHQQAGIADMVGEYDPERPDPSHAMIRVAARKWNSEKLEYGCKLLQRGVGVKIAAREAGVLVGDLKAHWEAHYVDAESDDYEHSSSDGSPVPR
eukprot:jgi/Ulvmu1/2929/UM149_0008.1